MLLTNKVHIYGRDFFVGRFSLLARSIFILVAFIVLLGFLTFIGPVPLLLFLLSAAALARFLLVLDFCTLIIFGSVDFFTIWILVTVCGELLEPAVLVFLFEFRTTLPDFLTLSGFLGCEDVFLMDGVLSLNDSFTFWFSFGGLLLISLSSGCLPCLVWVY